MIDLRRILPALLIVTATGCDDLGLSAEPEELRLEIEAVGADQVMLVTSTNWIRTNDPACNPNEGPCPEVLRVLAADSATVTTPHARTLRFTNDYRYLIEVFPAGGRTATLRMRIAIDGEDWYDEARELRPTGDGGGQETLQFVYQWRRPTIQ